MNLSWEREAEKAVRAAQTLFELSDLAWLDAAHALEFVDPSRAMESVLREVLESGPEPDANPAFEPEAQFEAREPSALPWPPSVRGTRYAPGVAAKPHSAPAVAARTSSLLAREDRADRRDEPDFGENSSAVSGHARSFIAEPTATHEARPDARHQRTAQPSAWIPLAEQGTASREMDPTSPTVRASLRQDEIDPGRADAPPENSSRTAEETLIPATRLRDAPAARGMRQVTTLPELQALFRSVVAESRSRDDRPPSETPRPLEAARSQRRSMPSPAMPPSSDPGQVVHAERFAGWSPPAGNDVAVGSRTEPPVPSTSESAPAMPDPLREEILLDRLLDRFEERLREQAIRHLGLTGGLT